MNTQKHGKTISILIADFDMKDLKTISKFHTSWHIREDEYSEIILTDKLEIHIIELKKLKVNNNYDVNKDKLIRWLKFIMNPNEMGVFEMDEDIKAAKKVLEEISQDEYEQQKAYLRTKHIMDSKSFLSNAYERGKTEGKEEEKKKIAEKLLERNIEIEVIIKVTGLKKAEIEEIKNKMK